MYRSEKTLQLSQHFRLYGLNMVRYLHFINYTLRALNVPPK